MDMSELDSIMKEMEEEMSMGGNTMTAPVAAPQMAAPGPSMAGPGPGQMRIPQIVPSNEPLPDFKNGEWITLYPIYLEASKSWSKGRRVEKEYACEHVLGDDIYMVLTQQCGLKCFLIRGKAHPRDPIMRAGYVKVRLKQSKGGKPCNPEYPTKKSLLKKCGQTIPTLPNYQARQQQIAELKKKQEEELANQAQNAAASVKKPSSKSMKKKKKR